MIIALHYGLDHKKLEQYHQFQVYAGSWWKQNMFFRSKVKFNAQQSTNLSEQLTNE